jgi:hypothetical protein
MALLSLEPLKQVETKSQTERTANLVLLRDAESVAIAWNAPVSCCLVLLHIHSFSRLTLKLELI